MSAFLKGLGARKVDKGIAHVGAVLGVHGEVEEVVGVRKAYEKGPRSWLISARV